MTNPFIKKTVKSFNLSKIRIAYSDEDLETPEQNQHYEETYGYEIPPEHQGGENTKTYEFGGPNSSFATIEKYIGPQGVYFYIINNVHGSVVFSTNSWDDAKERANMIQIQYKSRM